VPKEEATHLLAQAQALVADVQAYLKCKGLPHNAVALQPSPETNRDKASHREGSSRWKWTAVILLFATVGAVLAGGILAAVGLKDFADRFMTPIVLIVFGAAVLSGLYVNVRDIGVAWENIFFIVRVISWREHPQRYAIAVGTIAVVGAAMLVGGVVLLVLALL
jgi:hypothetical protein